MMMRNGEGNEPTMCRRCEEQGKRTVKPRYRMYEVKDMKGYFCPDCACELILYAEAIYKRIDSVFRFINNDED